MVLFGPGCKLIRREPVEARMGACRVVIVSPVLDDLSCMTVTGEQMFVQAFIAQASVKALDEAVLHWFSRLEEVLRIAMAEKLVQH